jgi:hypothetical protein
MRIRPLHALAPAALACLALALFTLALGQPAAAQTDGVPHVKNGAAPTGGVETLTLTELWRRGGEDDEEILFGIISDAEVGPDGNIYLLDAQLNEIKVLSPEGELLRSIGRQGEGPGEFQNAQQFTFLPDGNIGVAQVFPGKLIGLKPDGSPGKDIEPGKADPTAGGFFVLVNAESGGGNLVVTGIEMNFDQTTMSQKRHYFVRSYGMDGAQKVEFLGTERTWVFDDSFKFLESDNDFVWRRFGVSPKGQVVAAVQPLEYALNVYSAQGKLERVIERQYESWTRNDKVRQRYQSLMEAQSANFPNKPTPVIEDQEPDVQNIRCAADGTIWVLTSRACYAPEPGMLAAWDVFSPTGEFVKQVKAKGPGDPATDWLFLTDKGLAIQVTGFWDAAMAAMGGASDDAEGAAMQIICYRTK